ncbi:N-anthranilate isomerase [Rhodofomes roseus]|uniref:Multifunctional tryptophan biosynthesis protein n=1 Tax=Rhodofomes roseus TaxID=34475 RepID=A0ABQ8JYQ3_9APHY|nr:N-anthranilate isomerase [Rhodofomes roseus]KAH9828732.1 N-anthranilate isomerase [Rhodofomes roseus]
MPLPDDLTAPIDVLLIDNFDSFTWNLYQALSILGAQVTVVRNDAIAPDDLPALHINALIVSPGPGHPSTDSGISRDAIRYFTGKVPILGVCMGLQCLVDAYGGQVSYAGEIVHGKVSHVRHDGRGIFKAVPQSIKCTRYHSLSAGAPSLPDCLAVTATTQESGVIMGVRHREYTMEAVQYHPESILSESGDDLLRNFLKLKGGRWDAEENKQFGVVGEGKDGLNGSAQANGQAHAGPSKAVNGPGKAPTILERIYAQRMRDVEAAKATPGTSPADLDALLAMSLAPPLTSFVDALRRARRKPALMAEIKRASPSKGSIAPNANAAQQALTYALAGASVISVLTEPTWFKGSLLDMRLARQAVDALAERPAILRKDFIFDEYQIAEARLHGADTVLLIVAMLAEPRLRALYAYAKTLGMEPLVEVNNAAEMGVALALGARVVGVNNRNLHDFNVDMATTSRLAEMVAGAEVVLCALSGIAGPDDVRTYLGQGVGAVLVGESLMRAKDTRAFIRTLLDWPAAPPPADGGKGKEKAGDAPLVKICGIRTEDEALSAMEAGADMLGLMFVPSSKRAVSLAQAQAISVSVHASRFARPVRSSSPPLSPAPATPSSLTTNFAGRIAQAEAWAGAEMERVPWFAAHAKATRDALAPQDSPNRPLLVGVFQDAPLEKIVRAVEVAHLDMVQLHGREPAEWARFLPVPVVRVVHVGERGLDAIAEVTRPGLNQFVLLDAVRPGGDGLSGGGGVTLDWDIAREVVERGEAPGVKGADGRMPIILAGGLTPENVREAVETVHPWAIDVSGGVESSTRRGKDMAKVRAFIKAAKGW